jgi:VWFA-related protein
MRLRRVGQALALLAFGLSLTAQTHQESVEVSLVRVDLFVSDSAGNSVRDLKPSEVRLKVDGHDQPIVAVETVTQPIVPASVTSTAAVQKQTSAPTEPAVQAAAPSPTAVPPAPGIAAYAMAVFVDETSSEQFNRTAVYHQLAEFLQKPLPPGNLVLLERFDGKLHVECPWTSDVEKLRTALSNMGSHSFMPRIGQPGRISPAGGAGGTASSNTLAYMAVSDALLASSSGLIEAIRTYPATVARRKSLIVVTDGAPFLTASELVQEIIASSESSADRMPPQAQGDAIRREIEHDNALITEMAARPPRWFSQMTDATQLAVHRDIEIIPARSAMFDAEAGGLTADMERRGTRSMDSAISSQAITRRAAESPGAAKAWAASGMEQMASVTGGEAILSRARIGDQLRSEVDREKIGYVLTFRDPYPGDRKYHQIDIRVDRAKTKLRYRHGYRVLGSQEGFAERAVAGLYEEPKDNPLGARIETKVLRRTSKMVEFGVVVSYLLPAGTPAGTPRRVLVVGVSADKSGRRSEPFWINAAGRLESHSEGVLLLAPIRLRIDPQTAALSLGVRDVTTGLSSFFLLQPEL